MKKHYSTVILGATYYGLGYGSAHPDCLILEEFQTVGGDFHHCLHPVSMDADGLRAWDTPLGKLMREHGVWTGSGFDLLKASPVAHEFAARRMTDGMDILLDAHTISVEKNENGAAVTYVTNEGISSVTAGRLVDATADCVSAPDSVRCTAKTLNVFTVRMTADFDAKLQAACPDCRIIDGFNENEKLICFPVPAEETMTHAYRGVMETWKKAFPDGDEKILFVADDFDVRFEPIGAGSPDWAGVKAANPMAAFLRGVEA